MNRDATVPQYQPLLAHAWAGTLIGVCILTTTAFVLDAEAPQGSGVVLSVLLGSWLVSVLVTSKYQHKYPQRYYSYILASHVKAAAVMALALAILAWVVSALHIAIIDTRELWGAYLVFTLCDIVPSLPRRLVSRQPRKLVVDQPNGSSAVKEKEPYFVLDVDDIIEKCRDTLPPDVLRLVRDSLAGGGGDEAQVAKLSSDSPEQNEHNPVPAAVVLRLDSSNHLRRLNIFLRYATERTAMGGYFIFRYTPLEDELAELDASKRGFDYYVGYLGHFVRYRALPKIPVLEKLYFHPWLTWFDRLLHPDGRAKRRVISRAEMWGRIYYQGFKLVSEIASGKEAYIVAKRVHSAETKRKPSFFLIVGLTKVGLGGELIRLHKIRTMYPFSEFIQAKLFEDHGLSETGKFRNDFRLTGYGRVLRKYWLDEIPQIYDWLRGDIKLVGMRATSPHFLSLYPKELYDLYVQVKPGLIPPIFDASTTGFTDIVRIELGYLQDYLRQPLHTDIRYFVRTFNDIVFRGVRSK